MDMTEPSSSLRRTEAHRHSGRKHRLLPFIALLGLSACARQELRHEPPCRPLTVSVLRLPDTVRDASLRRVLNHDEKKTPAATLLQDHRQIDDQANQMLMAALTQAGVSARTGAQPLGDVSNMGHALTTDTLSKLHAQQPADVYLRWRVTDYGETPVRWAGAYIAFEVVTTLAIATAFYLHKVTRPVAGIYLIEESAEELSEGYAGFWALNRLSQPVRLEADLIDGQTGAELWHTSDTGLATWHLHHLWRMDDATQTQLLQSSTHRASRSIADALQQEMTRHCLP